MKLFDLDSPVMRFLSKMADLMILNILTMICCLPLFTAGAAFTALHYVCLKMVRNEEGYIAKSYFKAFKENFKQATIIWLIFLVGFGILVGDYYIIIKGQIAIPSFVKFVIGFAIAFVVLAANFVFAAQAKFANTVKQTIKNAFAMGIIQFPKSIVMTVLYVAPYIALYASYQATPIVFLFGFSVPVFACAQLYNKFFLGLEEKILAAAAQNGDVLEEDDGEKIFSDTLDESLMDK